MKKILLVIGLLMMISGCEKKAVPEEKPPVIPEEVTYLHEYELTLDNYETFITIDQFYLSMENENKRVSYVFYLNKEDERFEDVTIGIQLKVETNFIGIQESTIDLETTFSGKTHTYIATYSSFQTLKDYKITAVSGKVKSNTLYTIIDKELESKKAYESLISKMDTYDPNVSRMTVDQYITYTNLYQTKTTVIRTVIDQDNFYYSTIANGQEGTVVIENNGYYEVYQYIKAGYDDYLQLIAVTNSSNDFVDSEQTPLTFDESWKYTQTNGVYTIETTLHALLSMMISDEATLSSLTTGMENSMATMKLDMRETSMSMEITYVMNGVEVKIKADYLYNLAPKIDFNNATFTAPIYKEAINKTTDLDQGVRNQLFIPGFEYYYLIDIESGIYALEKDSSMYVEFYDMNDEKIMLKNAHQYEPFQTHGNLYEFEKGQYLVKVWFNINQVLMYDFALTSLDKAYLSIVDIEKPISVIEKTIEVVVEGKYDYVVYEFDSANGAILTLKPSGDDQIIEVYSNNRLHTSTIQTKDEDTIIRLDRGKNLVVFYSETQSKATYEVSYFAKHPESGQTLLDTFEDDFIYSQYAYKAMYDFTIEENSLVQLEMLLHDDSNKFGISYEVQKEINGVFTSQFIFNMNDAKSLYLETGSYRLIVNGVAIFKLKGTITPFTPESSVEANVGEISNMHAFEYDKDAYKESFDLYPNIETTIHFTLIEDAYLYVGVDVLHYNFKFILKDLQDNRINFDYQTTPSVYYLKAGTYNILPDINDSSLLLELKIFVEVITDMIVIQDLHPYDYQNIPQMSMNDSLTFTYDFIGDFEVVEFVLTESQTINIQSTGNVFICVFDESGKLMGQTYDQNSFKLDSGTYQLLLQHISSNIGSTSKVSLSVVSP
ncbi:MAG: hypothetical protein RBQ91_05225 [Acholeplasma sp.]|nr:hypothetical protein [Acholeplasma sp.]